MMKPKLLIACAALLGVLGPAAAQHALHLEGHVAGPPRRGHPQQVGRQQLEALVEGGAVDLAVFHLLERAVHHQQRHPQRPPQAATALIRAPRPGLC